MLSQQRIHINPMSTVLTMAKQKKKWSERETFPSAAAATQAKGIMERAVSRNETKKKKKEEKTVVSGKLTKALSDGNVDWLLFTRAGLFIHIYRERVETFQEFELKRKMLFVGVGTLFASKKKKEKKNIHRHEYCGVDDEGNGENRINLFACRGNFPMATAKL